MASIAKARKILPHNDCEDTDDPLAAAAAHLDIGPIKIEQDISTDYESTEETETPSKKARIEQDRPKKRTHKNREQGNILIAFMTKHPDIAKGLFKGERFVVDAKWCSLSVDLNAEGPPFKNVSSWKKVWSDWKISIKKKLLQIKKDSAGLGGGTQHVVLTPAEETIAQLCGFYDKVEVVRCGKSFGYPSEHDDMPKARPERRYSFSGAPSLQPTEDTLAQLCGSYEIVDVYEQNNSTSMDLPKKSIKNNADKAKCDQSADLDDDVMDKNRKRNRHTENLEELCSAQNALMTRVADSLDAIRSNMAEQTNVMLQHFKRMEEIELKKLEAIKCFKK